MEYIIENLTQREIDIMESSDIEWCPDDMSGDNKIGNMLLSHFCMMEDGNCMSCDTCNN